MLHKTRGIVLKVTDFGETSVVAKIYTELFGLQGYLINSVRKKNAKVKKNILSPLSLVDLIIYHKDRKGLQRISDIRPNPPLQRIPFDTIKSSIVFFLTEILSKSIHEDECNPSLFEFLFNAIETLDQQEPVNNDFHLFFLIGLSKYLGFYPQDGSLKERQYFNLQEGVFQNSIPAHQHFIEPPLTDLFHELMKPSFDFSKTVLMTIPQKRILTEKLTEYYQLHIDSFYGVQSHKILQEIWG